jgi:putative transcriptional regulator
MMKKNDIFEELQEGVQAWGDYNTGKITLKTHRVSVKSPVITPEHLVNVREKLNLSQAVFAQYLHAGLKTYQNWEQGLARPNKQAVLLIRMIEKSPQTLAQLASL